MEKQMFKTRRAPKPAMVGRKRSVKAWDRLGIFKKGRGHYFFLNSLSSEVQILFFFFDLWGGGGGGGWGPE